MSLWQEVRSNLGEWTVQAAERGERMARVGMHQVDRYGIHRRLSRQFTELGGEIHALLSSGEIPELRERPQIRAILDRIDGLEAELKVKDDEIANLKQKRTATDESDQDDPPREHPNEGNPTAS